MGIFYIIRFMERVSPKGQLIIDVPDFPIQPKNVDLSGHFFDAFDNNETEISARYIVRLAQRKGSWEPFTLDEIEAFYQEAGHKRFDFNRLIHPRGNGSEGGGWVIEQDNKYVVTTDFINRVHQAGEKNRQLNSQ